MIIEITYRHMYSPGTYSVTIFGELANRWSKLNSSGRHNLLSQLETVSSEQMYIVSSSVLEK
jgi:hypothetical protein